MSFYTRLRSTAERLIDTYGKGATLVRQAVSGPPHDPTVTEVEYTVRMVETGYSLVNRDSSLIEVGDKVGIISTADEAPVFDTDKIEIDGERHYFTDLQPLMPGGVTLLYEFTARQ